MKLFTQIFVLLACGVICHSAILKCRCLSTSKTINRSLIHKVEEIPPRPYCAKMEILVTLKNNKQACLDPTSKVGQAVLVSLKKKSERPAEVRTTRATTTSTTVTAVPTWS
ncbi:hypothetical protein OJAV_G00180540 [Oryzias javanicus]|uniref:Chemokine interleukin-8-like domain-containing protein n=1 Tax=Oryzias javanicus TaxID=123683 RepID=A0A3S2NZF0_ORYJA|nr:hypothetical protein OJAV_G00180540 [Oryzias javanicus]